MNKIKFISAGILAFLLAILISCDINDTINNAASNITANSSSSVEQQSSSSVEKPDMCCPSDCGSLHDGTMVCSMDCGGPVKMVDDKLVCAASYVEKPDICCPSITCPECDVCVEPLVWDNNRDKPYYYCPLGECLFDSRQVPPGGGSIKHCDGQTVSYQALPGWLGR